MDIDYMHDVIMSKLCTICKELTDIHKDIKYIKEQTESKWGPLPKLTTEVFNRPDCPNWAKWAAVDDDGTGTYYENKPEYDASLGGWLRTDKRAYVFSAKGEWCNTDRHNRLIERPAQSSDTLSNPQ